MVEAGGSSRAVCPGRGVASRSRHSRYRRRLEDLPLQGASATIKLQLGRCRCRNRKCELKIFPKHAPAVSVPHARQTVRLSEIRMPVGRGLGGPRR
jgi:transposase